MTDTSEYVCHVPDWFLYVIDWTAKFKIPVDTFNDAILYLVSNGIATCDRLGWLAIA